MFPLLCSSIAFASSAFVLVGAETRVDRAGDMDLRAKAIVDVGIDEHLSLTTTFVVSPGYAEAYIGPTWSPTAHFSLGAAGGMETADSPWRVMTYMAVNWPDLHMLGMMEYGGSGLWYKTSAMMDVETLSFGVLAQRFDGVGPRAAMRIGEVELWTAPLYDIESQSPNLLLGVNWVPR